MNEPRRYLDDPNAPSAARELLSRVKPTAGPPPGVLSSVPPIAGATPAGLGALAAKILIATGIAGAGAVSVWIAKESKDPPAVRAPYVAPVVVPELSAEKRETPAPVLEPRVDPPLDPPPAKRASRKNTAPAPIKVKAVNEEAVDVPPVTPGLAREELSEDALLLAARKTLDTEPARALELLDQHRTRFSGSELAQEREVLAVEALAALGRRREAAEHARAFLEAYQNSPYRARVEAAAAR